MEPILFSDIEAALVGWLRDILDLPHSVHGRVPNPRPERFITVQRTGGPRLNLVTDAPLVTFETWDVDTDDAAAAAAVVRAHVLAARNVRTPNGTLIHRVEELSGPFLLPDVSREARYAWNVRIGTRGKPL